jgi:hypothetical protein
MRCLPNYLFIYLLVGTRDVRTQFARVQLARAQSARARARARAQSVPNLCPTRA